MAQKSCPSPLKELSQGRPSTLEAMMEVYELDPSFLALSNGSIQHFDSYNWMSWLYKPCTLIGNKGTFALHIKVKEPREIAYHPIINPSGQNLEDTLIV